jgi:hypothetical protein
MLTGEFTLLEEPTEVSDVAVAAVLVADGSEEIESERRRDPRDPMQKLRLSIVRSIYWSRVVKTGTRVGGCGRKSIVPNRIWLPSIVELLCDEGENAVESMNLMPKLPTVGAN